MSSNNFEKIAEKLFIDIENALGEEGVKIARERYDENIEQMLNVQWPEGMTERDIKFFFLGGMFGEQKVVNAIRESSYS